MKRELTRDLLTIFTDKVWVCFKWGEQFEQVYGQWCLVCKWVREFWAITHNTYLGRPFCRDNKAFTDLKGLHRAFFTRSNMSCQTHICYHYDVYKFKCEADNLPMNNRCILWDLWKKMQTKSGGLSTQTTLDSVVQVLKEPKEFSRDALLHALAQLVVCNDEVSERGGEIRINKKLLMFTTGICISKQGHVSELFNSHASQNENKGAAELLWCHDLPSQCLHQIYHWNEASDWSESLIWSETCTHPYQDASGQVSITANTWTADTTKTGHFGITGHRIEVKDGKWTLRLSVISFKAISDDHSSDNLGHYFMSICEHVGIITDNRSKVCTTLTIRSAR